MLAMIRRTRTPCFGTARPLRVRAIWWFGQLPDDGRRNPRCPAVWLRPSKPGTRKLELGDDLANVALKTETIRITPHLGSRVVRVAPLTFTPYKLDHVTDKVNVTFMLNKLARVQLQVRNKAGRILRHSIRTSYVSGHHIVRWAGARDTGKLVTPNVHYWLRLVSTAGGETVTTAWHRVYAKKVSPKPPPHPGGGCVAAYPTHCFPGAQTSTAHTPTLGIGITSRCFRQTRMTSTATTTGSVARAHRTDSDTSPSLVHVAVSLGVGHRVG